MEKQTWYHVTFEHLYPDCPPYEDNPKSVFVIAKSFDDAAQKVENKYKEEFGRAKVRSVSVVDENVEFIII